MIIRPYQPEDLPDCIELGRAMHSESSFASHPFVPAKIRQLSDQCLNNPNYVCFVAKREDALIGLMVGLKCEHYFSDHSYAADLALYVLPPYRGSTAAVRLVSQFIHWATQVGCQEIRCGVTAGINDAMADKLYKRFGFEFAGSLYLRSISPLSNTGQ